LGANLTTDYQKIPAMTSQYIHSFVSDFFIFMGDF